MSKASLILLALIGGIVAGILLGRHAALGLEIADTVGTLWLNALRMTVVPLIVALLITGIAQTADAARAGRLAGRAVLVMLAILWGSSIFAALALPALLAAFPMPTEAAGALREALGHDPRIEPVPPFGEFLRAIVPTNPIAAAANDAILPLIVFTAAFAFAAMRLPRAKRETITGLFDAIAEAMIVIVGWVLTIAPLGVFALGFVVGNKAGTAALGALAHYVFALSALGVGVWAAAFLLAFVGARRGIPAFFRAAAEAQAVAISTQSSLASLPAMLRGMKALGVPDAKADVILPLAVAIFRATGPAMNLGVALYIANWYGVSLSPAQIAVGVAAGATTTLGAVSLPGTVSFISSIAPICLAMGLPVEPLALLIAVETFPDIFRTVGNVVMDMAVTATIAERTRDE